MIILGTNSIKDTGFDVANSIRFDDGSTSYLQKSASGGNRRTFTFSTWLKRANLLGGGSGYNTFFSSDQAADNSFRVTFNDDDGSNDDRFMVYYYTGSHQLKLITNRLFRDVSAWYHIVLAVDTTQGTASNRVKIYVNGVQETSFSTETYPSQNLDTSVNQSGAPTRVGAGTDLYFDGYMAETVLVDGSQLDPTSFGEFDEDSGIWKPIDVSGLTFGTNGFHLNYETAAELGTDANGGTALSETNLTALNQSTDTCTNNFATLNPLDKLYNGGTFTEGNLKVVTADSIYGAVTSTIGINSGKWYAEFKATDAGRDFAMVGIKSTPATGNGDGVGANDGYAYYSYNGKKVHGGTETAYGDTYDDGDIIGVAVDLDNNKIYWSKNGTFQNSGDPTTGSTGTGSAYDLDAPPSGFYFFSVSHEDNGDGGTWEANFGSPPFAISSGNTDGNGYGNFEYAVPSGYFSLNTKNLAEYG